MKISVLMPTFNDEGSIIYTIESLRNQTYQNWELLIMDDGSQDNTKQIIIDVMSKDDRIQYYYQENMDQLAAVDNLRNKITGEIVYILHSDDEFPSENTMFEYVEYIKKKPGFDAYYGDLNIINEKSKLTGSQIRPLKLKKTNRTLAITYLWLGRNEYTDMSFFQVGFFNTKVADNYLSRNIPYWFDSNVDSIANICKVDIPMLNYRVHETNYINSDIGVNSVLSGNLRVFTELMSKFYIPLFGLQYTCFRIFNKLKIRNLYFPIWFKTREKNMVKNISFVIEKRVGKNWEANSFWKSIVNFFKNSESTRTIHLESGSLKELRGRDSRNFFTKLAENNLEEGIMVFMEEVSRGFSCVEVLEEDYQNTKNALDFFCVLPFVEIVIKGE